MTKLSSNFPILLPRIFNSYLPTATMHPRCWGAPKGQGKCSSCRTNNSNLFTTSQESIIISSAVDCRRLTSLTSIRRVSGLKMKNNNNYFVIGVSGVTCGGKTTLSQLLQRSFPWCQVIYQDAYFLDDDDPRQVRLPHVEDHVNYEIPEALDLDRMEEDVKRLLSQEPPPVILEENGNGTCDSIPNMEEAGKELVEKVHGKIDLDTSKYRNVPIVILEGHILFCRPLLYDVCDVRFFLTLSEEECHRRRSERTTYIPPDVPGYFEHCIWPEFVQHFQCHIAKKDGIKVFNGSDPMESILKDSVKLIGEEIEKKFPQLLSSG